MTSPKLSDNFEPEIDPGFNMSFFERVIAFIRKLIAKIFGGFPAVL